MQIFSQFKRGALVATVAAPTMSAATANPLTGGTAYKP